MIRNVSVAGLVMVMAACVSAGGRERFTVRAPGSQWESVAVEPGDGGESPPLLLLVNRQSGAMVRIDELYGLTPGAAALESMADHERVGIGISEIDFSDPEGRVSFRTGWDQGGGPKKGRVLAFRLTNDRGAVFLATGAWPSSVDAAMSGEFDSLIANAKVVKPWW